MVEIQNWIRQLKAFFFSMYEQEYRGLIYGAFLSSNGEGKREKESSPHFFFFKKKSKK